MNPQHQNLLVMQEIGQDLDQDMHSTQQEDKAHRNILYQTRSPQAVGSQFSCVASLFTEKQMHCSRECAAFVGDTLLGTGQCTFDSMRHLLDILDVLNTSTHRNAMKSWLYLFTPRPLPSLVMLSCTPKRTTPNTPCIGRRSSSMRSSSAIARYGIGSHPP